MKPSVFLKFNVALAILLSANIAAVAQMPSASSSGVNSAIMKLFGTATTFSGKADVQMLDKSGKELLRMPMNFTALDGKLRIETDMMQIKSKDLTASMLGEFKKAGMDRIISITRPDRKEMYLIYMGARSYINMPMSKVEIEATGNNLKTEKNALGKETIDGHPCAKNRTIIKDSKGVVILDSVTWNATDLKDFPIQFAVREDENTSLTRFVQTQFTAPDAKLFEPPTDFTPYPSAQALMGALSKKQADKEKAAGK